MKFEERDIVDVVGHYSGEPVGTGYILEGPVRFGDEDENIYRVCFGQYKVGMFRESQLTHSEFPLVCLTNEYEADEDGEPDEV